MVGDMNVQQFLPQEPQHRVVKGKRAGMSILFLVAGLWRFIFWIWNILIAGAIAGTLGNAAYSYFTTGMLNFKDPRTLTVASWLSAHLTLWMPIFTVALLLTLCSYLAHHWRYRMTQANQQAHDHSLLTIAGGVQRALDELNARPPTPIRSAATELVNQEAISLKTIWNLPYRRNPFFTGREQLLTRLHDNLTTNRAAALTQAQAISGLGGIGKTQIAVEYAYLYRHDYRYILWVSAASRDTLLLDFVALAGILNLPEQQVPDQHITIAAVKHWLLNHNSWLLILDNADDLVILHDFLPPSTNGHILLTTRVQTAGTLANSIEVQEMDRQEGMLLLLRRARKLAPEAPLDQAHEEDGTIAAAIVTAMDGLPLAIDQAGAFLEETQCSLSDYLHLYQTRQVELLQRRGILETDYPDSVMTTWSLSFEKIQQVNPAAADLLEMFAFLDPDVIPEDIITEGASELGPKIQAIATEPIKLNEILGVLRNYSLLRRNDDKTLTIHRLVQVVLKNRMNKNTRRRWAERAIRAVNQTFPEITYEHWARCQQYIAQALNCAVLIEQWDMTFSEATQLLNKAGDYLDQSAQYEQAEPLYQRALAIRERVLGPDHPDTADSLNNLAVLYFHRGKYEQAEPLYQRALAIREQVLGPDHPDTANSLNNLAMLYHHRGKYKQAEPLLDRALAIRERVLGPDHPDTARSLNNLAIHYMYRGKLLRATKLLFPEVLAIFKKLNT